MPNNFISISHEDSNPFEINLSHMSEAKEYVLLYKQFSFNELNIDSRVSLQLKNVNSQLESSLCEAKSNVYQFLYFYRRIRF